MPYISNAERERADAERKRAARMTWPELLEHVMKAEQCDRQEARRQIALAASDGNLRCEGEEGFARNLRYSRIAMPFDAWLYCEADPQNPQRLKLPLPLLMSSSVLPFDQIVTHIVPLFLRQEVEGLWPAGSPEPSANQAKADSPLRGRQMTEQRPSAATAPASKRKETARGAKTLAVEAAVEKLWPNGVPATLPAGERNLKIVEYFKNHGGPAHIDNRTIQRALKTPGDK